MQMDLLAPKLPIHYVKTNNLNSSSSFTVEHLWQIWQKN